MLTRKANEVQFKLSAAGIINYFFFPQIIPCQTSHIPDIHAHRQVDFNIFPPWPHMLRSLLPGWYLAIIQSIVGSYRLSIRRQPYKYIFPMYAKFEWNNLYFNVPFTHKHDSEMLQKPWKLQPLCNETITSISAFSSSFPRIFTHYISPNNKNSRCSADNTKHMKRQIFLSVIAFIWSRVPLQHNI